MNFCGGPRWDMVGGKWDMYVFLTGVLGVDWWVGVLGVV